MSDEFEQALRRALRRRHPDGDLSARIVARLDATETPPASPPAAAARIPLVRHPVLRSRWLPAALAAGIVAAVGLVIQMRQHAVDTARANQARDQLLQALSIASDNINIVRTAVAREEDPNT
jgi:hypothetical protein